MTLHTPAPPAEETRFQRVHRVRALALRWTILGLTCLALVIQPGGLILARCGAAIPSEESSSPAEEEETISHVTELSATRGGRRIDLTPGRGNYLKRLQTAHRGEACAFRGRRLAGCEHAWRNGLGCAQRC